MAKYLVNRLLSKPGIQRDNTFYSSENYFDGQWCRFYEGVPYKMGGYEVIDYGNEEAIVNMYSVPKQNSIDLYIGRPSSIKFINLNLNGVGGAEIDRTPAVTFNPDPNNKFSFDLMTGINSTNLQSFSYICVLVAPNGQDVSNTDQGLLFYGDIRTTDPLLPIADLPDFGGSFINGSGGIVFVSPYLVVYNVFSADPNDPENVESTNGIVRWCKENDILSWPKANFSLVANTKIIKCFAVRGGGPPTFLAWSLNSLVRCTATEVSDHVQPTPTIRTTFVPDVIHNSISVLSADCIVEYDQIFYWIGSDQFYTYSGIVQKLTNTMSNDDFFQNVNLSQRAKIWGIAVPRFKEIWWHYPRGAEQLDCNAVIIYNIELNTWYDSNINRSAGVQASYFPYPLMADAQTIQYATGSGVINTFPIWLHERGTDKVIGTDNFAIESHFQTHFIDLFSADPKQTNWFQVRRVCPDFKMTTVEGQPTTMTLEVYQREYPQSFSDTPVFTSTFTGGPTGGSPSLQPTEKIDMAVQGALVSFKFISNQSGGFYQMGKTLLVYEVGDTWK